MNDYITAITNKQLKLKKMQSNLTSQAFFSQFLTGAQAAHQLGLNLAAGLLWHQCGSCGWLFCCVILVFWDFFFVIIT